MGKLKQREIEAMKKIVMMMGLLVAGAVPAKATSFALSQEYQKSREGMVQRAGRFSVKRPLAKAVQLHADVVFVPKAGDPTDYRLSAKLGVAMPLWTQALAISVAVSDEYNNSRGAWRNEAQGLASLSLRFASFSGR